MKIKKSLAALTATVSIMALATGCSSSGAAGVVDTQADKGLAVMGDTITYDPNHLVNDGQPIELGYWSWGDESTDPVISMLHEYEKIHPNVTFKISQVAWSDYWVKTPLSLKGNKNAPVLCNVLNSEDALLRPHAVRLDGASDWRIFHQVVLAMSRNSIAALAIFAFVYFIYYGRKAHGVIGYIKSLAPQGVSFPMNVLVWGVELFSTFLRLITLAVRLFCNMFAGHVVMGSFAIMASMFMQPLLQQVSAAHAVGALPSLAWLAILILSYAIELVVGAIQAYVFTVLTAVYVSEAEEVAEEE